MDERQSLRDMQDAAKAAMGVTCPVCGFGGVMPVVYTRRLSTGQTARVRECRGCRNRILCKERVVAVTQRRGVAEDNS